MVGPGVSSQRLAFVLLSELSMQFPLVFLLLLLLLLLLQEDSEIVKKLKIELELSKRRVIN